MTFHIATPALCLFKPSPSSRAKKPGRPKSRAHNKAQSRPAASLSDVLPALSSSPLADFIDFPSIRPFPFLTPSGGCGRHVVPYVARRPSSPDDGDPLTPTRSTVKQFIRNVRSAKTIADERAVIQKESAAIRASFREESHDSGVRYRQRTLSIAKAPSNTLVGGIMWPNYYICSLSESGLTSVRSNA